MIWLLEEALVCTVIQKVCFQLFPSVLFLRLFEEQQASNSRPAGHSQPVTYQNNNVIWPSLGIWTFCALTHFRFVTALKSSSLQAGADAFKHQQHLCLCKEIKLHISPVSLVSFKTSCSNQDDQKKKASS